MIEESHRVLGQDQDFVVIQHVELVERIKDERFALSPRYAGGPLTQPLSTSAVNFQNKNCGDNALVASLNLALLSQRFWST